MRRKTLTIRCNQCGKAIFIYVKIGKGKVWHCWKKRILENYSNQNGKKIQCECGNLIGIDHGIFIKLKQHNITVG